MSGNTLVNFDAIGYNKKKTGGISDDEVKYLSRSPRANFL